MSPVTRRALLWSSIYLALVLTPLAAAMVGGRPEPRGVLEEFGVLLGLLALGVFGMQLVASGRHRWFARGLGFDNVLQFHRQLGLFALLLVLVHPLVLLGAEPGFLDYLDPRDETLRALSLMALAGAALTLVVSSLWRRRCGLSYEVWRALHGGLALFLVLGGLGHALMVGRYSGGWISPLALIAILAVPVGLLLDSRLLRVWRLRRRPWRVIDNCPARGDATTLTLEAEGHRGLRFQPGQFIWVTLGDTPFSLQQHPFSLVSSAAEPGRVAFTAKRLGDFTARLPDVALGTRAFIEGPYGVFVPKAGHPSGAVLIAGGIGITPIMSILRSFRDRREKMPLWLVYANETWGEATFREELAELAQALRLEVIHVLAEPPSGWEGEQGYVDSALLKRRLPADDGRREYFICGPDPLMNAAEGALIAQGVAPTRVFSDRFDMV